MHCLIRRYAADGSASEQAITASPLTIGRSTTCSVQLTGAMVALEHATLRSLDGGRWRLESQALAGVEVLGVPVRDVEVLPGDKLRIGGFELTIEPPQAPHELVVSVAPLPADAKSGRAEATLDLRSAGLRQRRWALLGIALVVLAGLVAPLATRSSNSGVRNIGSDSSGSTQPPGAFAAAAQAFWSPGRGSHGHAHFIGDCARCHSKPFARIPEAVCRECHATAADHTDDPAARAHIAAAGDCSGCHREHRGPHGLVADSPILCSSCHSQPLTGKDGPLAAVTDFPEHPEFTPRPRQDAALEFSHEKHLRAEGIRGPDGMEHLQCAGCHALEPSRVSHGMPKYEDGCRRCHRLGVMIHGQETELPHGNNDAVLRMLQLAGSAPPQPAIAPPVAGLRQRAGLSADRGPGVAPSAQTPDTFEERLCAGCHVIEHGANGKPRVRPPTLQTEWMTAALFSHAPHQAVACTDCHTPSQGRDDSVMMPGVAACQTCHKSANADSGVPSACVECHRFHRHPANALAEKP